ncbi:WecB/TagA/CpsF family glycosyltransferase [Microbacterium sp. zg.Y625]|uniref:WecB/TagA/CpsF family glycosyltransferase n=1 Tax=Microbacterium jiangjiandongii TaxID=3049071 RepID=UPI00214C0A31|nr:MULTISPECIES: WecB/TagA/CpsF family glycosyltransferase [unclassified Microbacterium]MCR2793570.1 WecB/TagA/CpsF family glycosyltransferase [Microbacterium sp. zg.Y625]WIM25924.1 WecB/TagA/CpsF family glycosyltransferase [Microbacterium sp. zg-Y625]
MSRHTPIVLPVTALRPRLSPVPAPPRPLGGGVSDIPVITIGGGPVHLVDDRQARRLIMDATHAPDLPPLAVCSINLDHVHHFARATDDFGPDAPVRWLNLIDGAPIARQAERLTGIAYPRLAGSDLIGGILTDAAAAGLSVGVLGGSSEVTRALREALAAGWPGARFGGHWTPSREALSDRAGCAAVAGEIRGQGVDILLVCLGKPRQERWIAQNGPQTGATALLAFGAVVDFLAGRVSRAPRWVSRAGVEWMWRLMLEPRRLARRYLVQGPPAYVAVRRSHSSPRGHEPST